MSAEYTHGGRIFAVAAGLGIDPESIIDFSASINPLGPAPGVAGALAAAFGRIVHYPEIGSPRLVQALADYHALSPERIAVANGSTELIHLLPRIPDNRRQRALILAPAFSEYAHSLELAGWQCDYLVMADSTGFDLDYERIATALQSGYDLLFCGNPGNPTGRLYRRAETERLYRLCHDQGCRFILDEAFIDFTEEESLKDGLPEEPDWLILRSMTKFFGFPGLRLGYAIAAGELAARIRRHLPPWNIGVLAEAAGLAGLADVDHIRRTREVVAAERTRLAAGLAGIPGLVVFPGAANYLLLRTNAGQVVPQLVSELLRQGLLIRNCADFFGLDASYFRIAIRRPEENDRLLAALTTVHRQLLTS